MDTMIPIGSLALEFQLPNLKGYMVSTQDFRGRILYFLIWRARVSCGRRL